MPLFLVNCERTILFSVKRDLDPPFTTLNLVVCMKSFLFLTPYIPEFSDPQNPENVQPHRGKSSRENATPSRGTYPLVDY